MPSVTSISSTSPLASARTTAVDFSKWGYSGPTQFNYRTASLNVGRAYTLAQRGGDANVAAAVAKLPKKFSVSSAEWETIIKKERAALGNFKNEVTLLLGDSNTQAPYEIFARSSTGPLILNEAISGDNTAGILRRLKDPGLQRMDNKGRAILSGGTNDLRPLYVNGGKPSLAQVTAVIDSIVKNKKDSIAALKDKNPNASISLASILPAAGDVIPASVIKNANARIQQLATTEGVGFIDVTTALADAKGQVNTSLTTDGTHFNGAGYFLIGQKLGLFP
jgi:lysophospholipase L1-like esterase